MKSKYRLNDKVMVTSPVLYSNEHHLMGTINQIHNSDSDVSEKHYDIHYGLTGIDDLKNVPESDIIFWQS